MSVNRNKKVNTILSKLRKPRKKIDLGVVDELDNEFGRLEQAYSEASYLAYEWGDQIIDAFSDLQLEYNIDDYIVNGMTTDYEEISEIVAEKLRAVERSADELGVDPRDLFGYYDEAIQMTDNREEVNRDAYDKYIEVINYIGNNNFWR